MRLRNMGFALAGFALVGFSTAALAEVSQGSIARGGKLYDKWYKVIGVEAPTVSHPLYPATNEKYAADPAANWRCKECHGWDGLGAAGAYATGSHASGIKGIEGAAGGDPAKVVELLRGGHLFGDKLSDQDLTDLANFVVYGQVDWSALVVDKKSTGDAANGQQVYETACVGCHGTDGKLPKDMPPLGSLTSNPWEVTHKVLNGQPGEAMPALRAIDHQVSADLVAYLATLPAQ
ncbi:c-type cytochrome [Phaeovulum sp.]|uniref:c-type cytochrome n=2 Tax=Phaeovulum sp. TaxID=2934796 RepID=UPI0027313401|nr:cytochrome c [Phaeovulum sp.]MDP1667750.1 c-type cytochrome [Phaeovulum sp.]MDZ4118359.1 c-type cytochrome [Phaeovulum sp.]